MPADGAAHGAAVRDQLARVLRPRAVPATSSSSCARAACSPIADEEQARVRCRRCSRRSSRTRRSCCNEQVRNSILQVVHR
ncbi:MAG: hypothetical protein MZW92_07855 [Comamonadaceae bacterium]|nr:hypothetical protein [Comamonadaceae bacterium]